MFYRVFFICYNNITCDYINYRTNNQNWTQIYLKVLIYLIFIKDLIILINWV